MSDEINAAYSCTENGHILEDRTRLLDRNHVRRVCVIPGCSYVVVLEARS